MYPAISYKLAVCYFLWQAWLVKFLGLRNPDNTTTSLNCIHNPTDLNFGSCMALHLCDWSLSIKICHLHGQQSVSDSISVNGPSNVCTTCILMTYYIPCSYWGLASSPDHSHTPPFSVCNIGDEANWGYGIVFNINFNGNLSPNWKQCAWYLYWNIAQNQNNWMVEMIVINR